MSKGMFSQGVCLLTDGSAKLSDIKAILQKQGFEVVKENPAGEAWQFGGASLLISYRPQQNGYVAIDLVNKPWPDAMGDAKSDVTTMGAWSMGHFGPWTFPAGLKRAGQHAWNWQPAENISSGHTGFIRIRLSYAFGAADDAPILPKNYDPIDELNFISRLVLATSAAPGVICYFNPNGEVLRDSASFSQTWHACETEKTLPLLLWSNIRFFNISEQLLFMDTVGNHQLDVLDIEAFFPASMYEPGDVDYYLRNVTHYLIDSRPEFKSGETIDGPNETNSSWTIDVLEEGLTSPPREVLRLYPKKCANEVREVIAGMKD